VPKIRVILKNRLHISVGTIVEGSTTFGLLEGKSGTTTERVRFVLDFCVDCCYSQNENCSSGKKNLHSGLFFLSFQQGFVVSCELFLPFTRRGFAFFVISKSPRSQKM
jgi:hypothetical protein